MNHERDVGVLELALITSRSFLDQLVGALQERRGTVRPRALEVFRVMTSLDRVGPEQVEHPESNGGCSLWKWLREGSVAVRVIPAAAHGALGVDAAQLNNFSAGTIRTIGYNEVHEGRVVDKNEAVCRDQSVEPITGIGAGINFGSRGRGAKERKGGHKGAPLHKVHSRNPKPASLSTISMLQSPSITSRAYESPETAASQI